MGDRRATKIAKMMVLCWRLTFLPPRSNLLPHAFVWAIYIYIESIQVNCRSTVVKIVLIGNLRWPSSCLYLLYFSATVLFTCIKSWFFRIHLANFHQISHWSYYWQVKIICHFFFFFVSLSHPHYLVQSSNESIVTCTIPSWHFVYLCNMYICIYWGPHGRLAITCICVGAKCCNPQKIKSLLTYLLTYLLTVEMWLMVYSNDHAPLTVRPIYILL